MLRWLLISNRMIYPMEIRKKEEEIMRFGVLILGVLR